MIFARKYTAWSIEDERIDIFNARQGVRAYIN